MNRVITMSHDTDFRFEYVQTIGKRYFLRRVCITDPKDRGSWSEPKKFKVMAGNYQCFVSGQNSVYIEDGVSKSGFRMKCVGISFAEPCFSHNVLVKDWKRYEKIGCVKIHSEEIIFSESLTDIPVKNKFEFFCSNEKAALAVVDQEGFSMNVNNGTYPVYALKDSYENGDEPEIVALVVDLSGNAE